MNKPKQEKFNPRTAEYQTVDELRSQVDPNTHKRELYTTGDSHDDNLDSAATLTDYVVLYLESNSSEKRGRDFQQRMIAYYERIRELAQRST